MTFSYGRGENEARLPWESDKIAKFVEEKVMAEGRALKIQGCFYAVFGLRCLLVGDGTRSDARTLGRALRRSTVAHFARKVRGTNFMANTSQRSGYKADLWHFRYVFVALTLRAK